MAKEYVVDANSYYTTLEQDLNSYNTHILENIVIEFGDGERVEAQMMLCNLRVSYSRATSMISVEEELDDWTDGLCPQCIEEWREQRA